MPTPTWRSADGIVHASSCRLEDSGRHRTLRARSRCRLRRFRVKHERKAIMTDQREVQRVWTKALGALALGAALMYTLDPDKGRRRRAVARDKAYSVLLDAREAVGVTRRDIAHRLDGLRARVDRLVRRRPAPDDLQLIERVRARMGRLVSHPHAIQVGSRAAIFTLSGPILAREAAPLLTSMRNVWGVSEIEDRLVAYEHPENKPRLQGETPPASG